RRRPPGPPPLPYTTLFRSDGRRDRRPAAAARRLLRVQQGVLRRGREPGADPARAVAQARARRLLRCAQAPARGLPGPVLLPPPRSEEHTSELQSRENLVCR